MKRLFLRGIELDIGPREPKRCDSCQALVNNRPHLPGCAKDPKQRQGQLSLGATQGCPHSKDSRPCAACVRQVTP